MVSKESHNYDRNYRHKDHTWVYEGEYDRQHAKQKLRNGRHQLGKEAKALVADRIYQVFGLVDELKLFQVIQVWDKTALHDNEADLHSKDDEGSPVEQLTAHLDKVFLLGAEFL